MLTGNLLVPASHAATVKSLLLGFDLSVGLVPFLINHIHDDCQEGNESGSFKQLSSAKTAENPLREVWKKWGYSIFWKAIA